jgi:hypothetical protein
MRRHCRPVVSAIVCSSSSAPRKHPTCIIEHFRKQAAAHCQPSRVRRIITASCIAYELSGRVQAVTWHNPVDRVVLINRQVQ